MERKFFRELNSNKISNAKITAPSKEELKMLLIEKLKQKAKHIDVLLNKAEQEAYLLKKGKLEEASKLSDAEINQFLAKRLITDIYQLFIDLCKVFNEKVQINPEYKSTLNAKEIQKELDWCCEKLLTKKTKSELLVEISNSVIVLCTLYNLSFNEIEETQKEIEQKEGSYYNGKIVIYN